MLISARSARSIRYALGTLLAFGALNAFAGAYYGVSGAAGVPLEWLAVLAGSRFARRSAFIGGTIVLGWICAGWNYARAL